MSVYTEMAELGFEDIQDVLDEYGSGYIEIDNGWRIVDGERVGGWTCRIVSFGFEVEATRDSMEEAVMAAGLKAWNAAHPGAAR